jgi:hypothetical protein
LLADHGASRLTQSVPIARVAGPKRVATAELLAPPLRRLMIACCLSSEIPSTLSFHLDVSRVALE